MLHFDVTAKSAQLQQAFERLQYWAASSLMKTCLFVMPRGRYRDELKLALHDLKVRAIRECFAMAVIKAENPARARLTNAEHITIDALRKQAPHTSQPELLRTAAKMIDQYGTVTGHLFDVLIRARDGDSGALHEAIDTLYVVRRPTITAFRRRSLH